MIITVSSVRRAIPSSVNSVRSCTLTRRYVTTLLVSSHALLIRRVVMLRRILAYTRIILLGLLLHFLGLVKSRLILSRLTLLRPWPIRSKKSAI